MSMRVALIQSVVVADKQANVTHAASQIRLAARQGADMVVLAEMFCCPYQTANFPVYAEQEGGPAFVQMATAARENAVYLVAGTMPESDAAGNVYNTAYAFDRDGRLVGKHRKMHLFDIAVQGGQHFKESDTLTAGDTVNAFDTEFGRIGLVVCYDIRFPELSRLLTDRGAKVIVVPAAFNMTTGPAHWDILFRSRALDNQVYLIGVAPARQESERYVSYGHSLVVSPWGDIVSQMGAEAGMVVADLDLDRVDRVRQQIPVLTQRRRDVYELVEMKQRP